MADATTLALFQERSSRYESYVQDNWETLSAWEREQAASFFAWASDSDAVSEFVKPQVYYNLSTHDSWEADTWNHLQRRPWSIAAGYTIAFVGFFLVPFVLQPIAIGIGLYNLAKGRFWHGAAQVLLAGTILAFNIYAAYLIAGWIRDLETLLRTNQT